MKNTKEMKENQGITLIALVITIIVLLILAGVSIAALTGNNGILTQAGQAKDSNNIAGVKEKVEVEALGSIDKRGNFNKETFKTNVEKNLKGNVIENGNTLIVKLDGYKITVDEMTGNIVGEPTQIVIVKPGITVSKTEKDNYSDGTDTATIPEGFSVDETENTISKGLVVHGPDKVNGDNGSEFVWIPVPDINNMAQCSTAGGNCDLQLDGDNIKCITHDSEDIVGKLYSVNIGNNSIDDTANKTYNANSKLREPAYLIDTDYGDKSKFNTIGLTLLDLQTDYKNMATSVAKYKGFYVGRYETSLSNATATESKDGNVQSKAGVMPTSAYNSTTYRWYGLYSKQNKTYTGTNNSVESSMIWGSQYDRIINWVKEGSDETNKTKLSDIALGNHSGKIATTGNSNYSNDNINNIRDLGGNRTEWTLEAYETNSRINRGSHFNESISLSCRLGYNSSSTDSTAGSRLTLYIK